MVEVTVHEGVAARLTPEEIRKYKKLPRWLRDMVDVLQDELEEVLAARMEAADLWAAQTDLADLWGDIALRRMRAGDTPGYLRACRSADILRGGPIQLSLLNSG